jgi:competence protein ComEC
LQNGESAQDENKNNEMSAGAYFDYQGVGALFAGDISAETEKTIMRDDSELDGFSMRNFDLTSTEILKVAHHGSKYSTSRTWLEYLHTETAVISCGANNPYGHPTDETLSRLTAVGADIWRTDLNGNVVVTITKLGEYKVKSVK